MTDPAAQIGGPHDPAGPHAPFPPAAWATQQTSTNAVAALTLAVLSFVFLPFVGAVVALILARTAEEEIAASAGRVTGHGLAHAARVTAWANIALCLLAVAVVVAFVLLAGALL